MASILDLLTPDSLELVLPRLCLLDAILGTSEYFSDKPKIKKNGALIKGCSHFVCRLENEDSADIILWRGVGAVLKGCSVKSPIGSYSQEFHRAWPGIFNGMPRPLDMFSRLPWIAPHRVSFCYWRTPTDDFWQSAPIELPAGVDPGGERRLLTRLIFDTAHIQRWAESLYHVRLSPLVLRELIEEGRQVRAADLVLEWMATHWEPEFDDVEFVDDE